MYSNSRLDKLKSNSFHNYYYLLCLFVIALYSQDKSDGNVGNYRDDLFRISYPVEFGETFYYFCCLSMNVKGLKFIWKLFAGLKQAGLKRELDLSKLLLIKL